MPSFLRLEQSKDIQNHLELPEVVPETSCEVWFQHFLQKLHERLSVSSSEHVTGCLWSSCKMLLDLQLWDLKRKQVLALANLLQEFTIPWLMMAYVRNLGPGGLPQTTSAVKVYALVPETAVQFMIICDGKCWRMSAHSNHTVGTQNTNVFYNPWQDTVTYCNYTCAITYFILVYFQSWRFCD